MKMMNRHKVLRHIVWTLFTLVPLLLAAQTGDLPRSTPAEQGVDSALLQRFIDDITNLPGTQVHHLMVVRHGAVIGELHAKPYTASHLSTMYSASKTVVALAVGLAIDDGLLRVDDKVSQYLADKMPDDPSQAVTGLTVRDLLMMAAGREPDEALFTGDTDWLSAWLRDAFSTPGQRFQYDSMCTYALATIVTRVTGKSLLQLVGERLFSPMGITSYDWELAPDSIEIGAWGLRLHTESEAKLGILMLNQGKWNGRQLVSGRWIQEMTQRRLSTATAPPPRLNTWQKVLKLLRTVWHEVRSWFTGVNVDDYYEGYGYQTKSIMQPLADAFFAAGYGGQLIYVVPRCDLVVVINGMSRNYGDELGVVYNRLVTPLLTAQPDESSLRHTEHATDSLPCPMGSPDSPIERKLTGSVITLDNNKLGLQTIRIAPTPNGRQFTITSDRGTITLTAACGMWRTDSTASDIPLYATLASTRFIGISRPLITASAYAWADHSRLTLQSLWLDGGDCLTLELTFNQGATAAIVSYNDNNDPLLSGTTQATVQADNRHQP